MALTLTPLPASASIASRILRLPASAANKTLCLLDAAGRPVPLEYLANDERINQLRKPGFALELLNGSLGLVQTKANKQLPPAVGVGGIDYATGAVFNQAELVYSDFIPIEAAATLTFLPSSSLQYAAFYDGSKNYLASVNDWLFFNNDTTPPNAAYMRVAADAPTKRLTGVKYHLVTYTMGQLPYVRSINYVKPDANGNVVYTDATANPQVVTTTVLHFDKNYVHAPISSGTFTVDTTGLVVGKEVVAYLTATAGDPAAGLPAATFQLLSGAYKAGTELMYTFRVGGNGKIQYVITELP
jgi:hypothetical protein